MGPLRWQQQRAASLSSACDRVARPAGLLHRKKQTVETVPSGMRKQGPPAKRPAPAGVPVRVASLIGRHRRHGWPGCAINPKCFLPLGFAMQPSFPPAAAKRSSQPVLSTVTRTTGRWHLTVLPGFHCITRVTLLCVPFIDSLQIGHHARLAPPGPGGAAAAPRRSQYTLRRWGATGRHMTTGGYTSLPSRLVKS